MYTPNTLWPFSSGENTFTLWNTFLSWTCAGSVNYPIPTVHWQAPPSVLGWRWRGVEDSGGGAHRLPVLHEWGRRGRVTGRLVEGETRLAREESRCLSWWLAAEKHGAERMERNTASSAEEERETKEKSIAHSHRYYHCCLGSLRAYHMRCHH